MKPKIALIAMFICIHALHADAPAVYESGKRLQNDSQWYSAIEKFQEAVVLNAAYWEAYKGLAECFYALGEYTQALAHVDKAESLRKKNSDLLNLRGFILIGLARMDEARKEFETVLAMLPNDASARFGLAEIEILAGRISSAANFYIEALRRNPENRKALLSLAILSNETGNQAASREYINRALKYHGDNPQVFYFAAYLSQLQGSLEEAEKRIRTAISLKPDYDEALALLSTIYMNTGRYSEAIQICDQRISLSRDSSGVWYVRALAYEKMGRFSDALKSSATGLEINPEDEILRALSDNISMSYLSLENESRKSASAWHADKAASFERKKLSDQALYEYRRALKINPYDYNIRSAYAKQLLNKGFTVRFVEQLEFIQSIGKSSVIINDSVESYRKMLSSALPAKWNIDPLYLEKAHTSIGLYYYRNAKNLIHTDAERLTAVMIADALNYDQKIRAYAADTPSQSYAEAFRRSRTSSDKYFGLVSFKETERDLNITVDLYVSSSGSKAGSFSVYRTGNDRYANAVRRIAQRISESIPVYGVLLARHQQEVVLDLGKSDKVIIGSKFDIIPVEALSHLSEGIGIRYDKKDVLGTIEITEYSDDISQGKLTIAGFYDRIKKGDIAVPVDAVQNTEENNAADAIPQKGADNPLLQIVRSVL